VKAKLTPEADLDAQDAIRWYDERDRALGDDFLQKVNDCIAAIQENPQKYPILHRHMRRGLVRRFPYEIIFEIENDEIIIYAIYHCARDPEVWKHRRDA
jgi:plasmid stabilization system protein ParE